MKHFVICENDCLVEGMTKEETLALVQSATGYIPTGEEEAIISQIINQNSGGGVKIWFGTRAEYNALGEHDANTIYHITDDKTGNEAYNKALEAVEIAKSAEEIVIEAKKTADNAMPKSGGTFTDVVGYAKNLADVPLTNTFSFRNIAVYNSSGSTSQTTGSIRMFRK